MPLYEPVLFPAGDAYADVPVDPEQDEPTPAEIVAGLTTRDRARRVRYLTAQSLEIVSHAIDHYANGRELVAKCVLFSGGDDSTAVAHMFRRIASHAIHAHTGTGI